MVNHTTQQCWDPLQKNCAASMENKQGSLAVTLVSLTRVHQATPWPPGDRSYQSPR
jgi:hypothetical protein